MGNWLDRKQATTLLKELSNSQIIDTSWVSLESKADDCKIKLKATQKTPALQEFLSHNNLTLEQQGDYWFITGP